MEHLDLLLLRLPMFRPPPPLGLGNVVLVLSSIGCRLLRRDSSTPLAMGEYYSCSSNGLFLDIYHAIDVTKEEQMPIRLFESNESFTYVHFVPLCFVFLVRRSVDEKDDEN